MDTQSIVSLVESNAFGIWYLIGAALVFFMQAGFAMVETGFTRAKNAGNIIMKNLMDFCIGTIPFVFIGFSLMMAENYLFGFIGVPNMQIFTDFGTFIQTNASSFVFNLVFCATAATIVSGAMAERTKFSAYCVYSAVVSAVIYPIEAGWVLYRGTPIRKLESRKLIMMHPISPCETASGIIQKTIQKENGGNSTWLV